MTMSCNYTVKPGTLGDIVKAAEQVSPRCPRRQLRGKLEATG